MSLYWSLAAAVTHRVRGMRPAAYVASAAAIWTAADFLRSTILGGFPWLQFGHTQSPLTSICQIADTPVVLLTSTAPRAFFSSVGKCRSCT